MHPCHYLLDGQILSILDKGPISTLSRKERHAYSQEYQGLQVGTLFAIITQVFAKL
jgi:hypothetical protein